VNRITALNGALLLLALGGTVALGWPGGETGALDVRRGGGPARGEAESHPEAVADAEGRLVPRRNYTRIVSTNLVTDRLLLELCEPTRVLAVSRAATERKRDGYRYQGMGIVDGFGPVESIVALGPDLVLSNRFGAPGSAERIRDAGIAVFDLGDLRGESSFTRTVKKLGDLLGVPERAHRLLSGFTDRFHKISASLPKANRRRALFLTILGPDLQGGTVGTSYHDIMVAAGLVDVAADGYRDWPSYDAEQVLALAPDLIVTRQGFAGNVCGFPGMDRLAPCRGPGRIVEVSGELLDEPGLAMLEAAEDLFAQVYGHH
jgi:iron complex transport system substrate-binding protein